MSGVESDVRDGGELVVLTRVHWSQTSEMATENMQLPRTRVRSVRPTTEDDLPIRVHHRMEHRMHCDREGLAMPSRYIGSLLVFVALPLAACSNTPSTSDSGADVATLDAATVPDAPSCSSTEPCADQAATCCNSRCTYVDKDPQNCGACGVACNANQFCNGKACFDAVVSNLCINPAAAVVLDGLSADDQAGNVLGIAMNACSPSVVVHQIVQGASSSMDSTGRPLLGPGDTYVTAGGGFGQKAIAYLSSTHAAPVYVSGDSSSISFVRSSDNGIVVQVSNAALTNHHDYFVSYTAVEPQSGTLVFTVYGFYSPGTAAGVFWFQKQVMTNLAAFSKAFYVLEWTDTDNDGLPSAPDTFTVVGSG